MDLHRPCLILLAAQLRLYHAAVVVEPVHLNAVPIYALHAGKSPEFALIGIDIDHVFDLVGEAAEEAPFLYSVESDRWITLPATVPSISSGRTMRP